MSRVLRLLNLSYIVTSRSYVAPMNGLRTYNFLAHFLERVISRVRLIRRTREIDERVCREFVIVFAYVRD